MRLDVVIVWCLYVAALEAQKRQRFKKTRTWHRDVVEVRLALAAEGLTL